jgi:predicted RNA-binding protein YlqC (UPF0109 family)
MEFAMEKEFDREFVEYIVKALVDSPDKVKVTRTIDERGVLIELSVDPTDMGKVIGKEGQTAKAIRTLLRVVGAKHNARVNFKIAEPEGKAPSQPKEEQAQAEEEKSEIEKELGV